MKLVSSGFHDISFTTVFFPTSAPVSLPAVAAFPSASLPVRSRYPRPPFCCPTSPYTPTNLSAKSQTRTTLKTLAQRELHLIQYRLAIYICLRLRPCVLGSHSQHLRLH